MPQCLGSHDSASAWHPVATVSEQQPGQLNQAEQQSLGTGPPGLVGPQEPTKRTRKSSEFSGETKGETTGIAVMFLGDSSQ